jgi:predicted DNA-binding ribbon-helix-helix protein
MSASFLKHSVVVDGRRTSVSLEGEFWEEIKRVARHAGVTVNDFVATVSTQTNGRNLSSALRLAVLADLKALAVEQTEPSKETPL